MMDLVISEKGFKPTLIDKIKSFKHLIVIITIF